jgi:hypothetical protein
VILTVDTIPFIVVLWYIIKGQLVKHFFVGPEYWRKIRDDILSDVTQEEVSSFAASIIQRFHGRHIGIPLKSSVSLADFLINKKLYNKSIWQEVSIKLAKESGRHDHSRGFNIERLPYYYISQIVEIIAQKTLEKISINIVFCEFSQDTIDKFEIFYKKYSAKFEETLLDICSNDSSIKPYLWSVWGSVSLALAHKHQTSTSTLPNIDIPLVLMMENKLEPVLSKNPLDRKSYIPKPIFVKEDRQGYRPKEDGIKGIRVSQRIEDIEDILQSELLVPPPLLLDKLINNGFLVRHRPPKSQKRKDVLILGVMPFNPCTAESTVLKSAWFHFTCWAILLLHRTGLSNSEFLWIEGDHLGGAIWHQTYLADMSTMQLDRANTVDSYFRKSAIQSMHWIPGFVTKRFKYDSDYIKSFSRIPFVENLLAHETLANWLVTVTNVALKTQAHKKNIAANLNDYSFILFNFISPFSVDSDKNLKKEESSLHEALDSLWWSLESHGEQRNISLVKFNSFSSLDSWAYGSKGYGKNHVSTKPNASYISDPSFIGQTVSGEIIDFWLDILQEATLCE